MFFDHRPKNIRLTKKNTRIRITFHYMLYNFYLTHFSIRAIIKNFFDGRLDPRNIFIDFSCRFESFLANNCKICSRCWSCSMLSFISDSYESFSLVMFVNFSVSFVLVVVIDFWRLQFRSFLLSLIEIQSQDEWASFRHWMQVATLQVSHQALTSS